MRTREQKWLLRSAKLNAKAYDPITSPCDFADALERDARAVVADRHLEVDFNSEPLQTLLRRAPATKTYLPLKARRMAVTKTRLYRSSKGRLNECPYRFLHRTITNKALL